MTETVDYIAALEALKAQYPDHPEYYDMASQIADELEGVPHSNANTRIQVTSKLEEIRQKIAEYELQNPGFIQSTISDFNSSFIPDWIENGSNAISGGINAVMASGEELINLAMGAGETNAIKELQALRGQISYISEHEAAEIAYKTIQERASLENYSSISQSPVNGLFHFLGKVSDFFEAAWLAVKGNGSFSEIYSALQEERETTTQTANSYVETARGRSLELFETVQEIEFGAGQTTEEGVALPAKRTGPDLAAIVTRINPANKRFTGYPLTEKAGNVELDNISTAEQREHNPTWRQQVYDYYAGDNTALKLFMTVEIAGLTYGGAKAMLNPQADGLAGKAMRSTATGRIIGGAIERTTNLISPASEATNGLSAANGTQAKATAPTTAEKPAKSKLIQPEQSGGGTRTPEQQARMMQAREAAANPSALQTTDPKPPRIGKGLKIFGIFGLALAPAASAIAAAAYGEDADGIVDAAKEATPLGIDMARQEGRHAEAQLRTIDNIPVVGFLFNEIQRPWQRHVVGGKYGDVDPGIIEGAIMGLFNNTKENEKMQALSTPLSDNIAPAAEDVFLEPQSDPVETKPCAGIRRARAKDRCESSLNNDEISALDLPLGIDPHTMAMFKIANVSYTPTAELPTHKETLSTQVSNVSLEVADADGSRRLSPSASVGGAYSPAQTSLV